MINPEEITDEEKKELDEDEIDYVDWINSIEFVDDEGQVLDNPLEDDVSDDPDNDRAEDEEAE